MLNPSSSKSQKLHTYLGLSLCGLLQLILLVSEVLQGEDIAQVKEGVVKITAQVDGKKRVGSGAGPIPDGVGGVAARCDDKGGRWGSAHVYRVSTDVTALDCLEWDPERDERPDPRVSGFG